MQNTGIDPSFMLLGVGPTVCGTNSVFHYEWGSLSEIVKRYLKLLFSRVHSIWALAAGGRLGVGNDPRYNNSVLELLHLTGSCTQDA